MLIYSTVALTPAGQLLKAVLFFLENSTTEWLFRRKISTDPEVFLWSDQFWTLKINNCCKFLLIFFFQVGTSVLHNCWVFWHQKVMMSKSSLFLCKWSMRYWLIQCRLWAVIWKWKGRFPTFEGIHYFLLSSSNWLLYKKWELKGVSLVPSS